MKRRKFIRYVGASCLATLGAGVLTHQPDVAQAQSEAVSIQWLGHTCFLFSGAGRRMLVNPFNAFLSTGCTVGYRPPQVQADVIMISSRLLDEGFLEGLPGNPRVLSDPGIYDFTNMRVEGIASDHDRIGGLRFGTNVMWRWNQGGLTLLHMGGVAAPITVEQQILIGRPDVVFIPVGGSDKAYTPEEAKAAIETLNPRLIVPTHYRTDAADEATCDITPLENFLMLMEGTPIRRHASDAISLSRGDLPADEGSRIEVLTYSFGAAATESPQSVSQVFFA